MKLLQYPLGILYRIWFYILVALPIILLLPLLLISISKERWYPYFFKLAKGWAWFILIGMGFRISFDFKQVPKPTKSYMFVANHTSMVDIMLMLVTVRNPFVFVGKKELVKIPLFGYFYKRTCIMVDRTSSQSRQAVFLRAQRRLKQGLSICIFPEGGVPEEEILLDEFKDGAFRLAINHSIPVVPMAFLGGKQRFPFSIYRGGPGYLRVIVNEFLPTDNLTIHDTKSLNKKARGIILSELKSKN